MHSSAADDEVHPDERPPTHAEKRTDAHDVQTAAHNREAVMRALLVEGGSPEYWEQVVEDRREHESVHPDDVGHVAEASGR